MLTAHVMFFFEFLFFTFFYSVLKILAGLAKAALAE